MKGKPISTIALMHYWEWETELARKEIEMNEHKQIEQERWDMAKIMADNFHINGEGWGDSDFKWMAHCLQMEGYHKQSKGKWRLTAEPLGWHDVPCIECSVCGDSWVLDGDFDFEAVLDYWHYCPNCGARLSGGQNE